MRHLFRTKWQSLTIKKKILTFTGVVFFICILSIVFDAWVVKFSLIDFNHILEENAQSVELVQSLEEERRIFREYVQKQGDVTLEMYQEAVDRTREAVYDLPFSYELLGEARYAQTWSIRNSYEVYVEYREGFLEQGRSNPTYIDDLYELYEMQNYLLIYAQKLMTNTLESGSEAYWERMPSLVSVPGIVIAFGCVLLCIMLQLSNLMNKTIISPVMKLVDASKKIANNDFFIEDVSVENQDELGELVHAFNKMKYATGEYITALEEKRTTLDLLHQEELERLAVEKQLESIKLELLKSQVNPHFLFNTLNVIGGMASLEEAETTEKMIRALSSLFRYNLKSSDVEVPLARELKVVEYYMYLQQMRFGERIAYDVKCDVNKEKVLVPTYTFQPLVENAIIHGLSKMEEGGTVRVRIGLQEGAVHIYIGDTGKGMKEEELESLRLRLKGERKRTEQSSREWLEQQKLMKEGRPEQPKQGQVGIGLGNIYRRITAMYPEGRMEIYSKYMRGTVVKLVIPQRSGE